jgi:hypothetical protein
MSLENTTPPESVAPALPLRATSLREDGLHGATDSATQLKLLTLPIHSGFYNWDDRITPNKLS